MFLWNPTRLCKSKQPFLFRPTFEWFLYEILLDQANRSNLFSFESFWMAFVWNPCRPRKFKRPFQFWLVFEWLQYEILLDHRRNLFNFDLLNSFWKLANRSNLFLTHFWMVFCEIWKSKQPFQFWPVLNGFYEILLDHANRSNLFNFESFWMVSIWNPSRPRKFKWPFQFWLIFEWLQYEILLDHANRRKLVKFWLVFE